MKQRSLKEIEDKVKELWPDVYDDEKSIGVSTDYVSIRLSAMYEAPGLSFQQLMALSEFFETKNINDDDRFSFGGCETCDYGSEYGFTLTVRPD